MATRRKVRRGGSGDERPWKKEARKAREAVGDYSALTLPEGDTSIRVLPDPRGSRKPPWLDILQHANVGPKRGFQICGKDLKDPDRGECWLCDVQIPKLLRSNKRSLRERAMKIEARRQTILSIATIDRDGDWVGPLLWYPSTGGNNSLAAKVKGLLGSATRNYEDPVRGYNFTIKRVGTGMKTRYDSPVADEEPSEVPRSILRKLKPLPDAIPEYDETRMQNAYYGRENERDDEPEDDWSDVAEDDGYEEEEVEEAEAEGEDYEEGEEEEYEEEPDGEEGDEEYEEEPDEEWEEEEEPDSDGDGEDEAYEEESNGEEEWEEEEEEPGSEYIDPKKDPEQEEARIAKRRKSIRGKPKRKPTTTKSVKKKAAPPRKKKAVTRKAATKKATKKKASPKKKRKPRVAVSDDVPF